MIKSRTLRRLVAVTLMVAGLVVLPVPAALAAGEDGAQAAEKEDQGILQEVLGWILDLVGADDDGELGPQLDPTGRA